MAWRGGLRSLFKRFARRFLIKKNTTETPKRKNIFAEVFFYAQGGGHLWGEIVRK